MAAALPTDGSDPRALAATPAPREPYLFRFGLRRFFVFVTAFIVLLGAMAYVGAGWALAVGFGASMVAAHIIATFLGTRLRDSSREIQSWTAGRYDAGEPERPPQRGRLTAAELAALSASPLARRDGTPRRTLAATCIGLFVGASLGAAAIPLVAGPEATGAETALGAISCAIIAAWLALLASHFWSVARRTWRDARGASGAQSSSANRPRRRWFRS
jgi:hypothetical protein